MDGGNERQIVLPRWMEKLPGNRRARTWRKASHDRTGMGLEGPGARRTSRRIGSGGGGGSEGGNIRVVSGSRLGTGVRKRV